METALEPVRLGVIGLSEGNGHPYSWSAIVNGYDPMAMSECPFPVIPRYLAQHEFPQERIQDARVTHVWTQDRKISEHIARSCLIDQVVDRYADMVGQVDGVLLARDDHALHFRMSEPFLDAGIPVYIDKPLSVTVSECDRILGRERFAGQVFSCSALRYAREFNLPESDIEALGPLRHVDACVPKSWELYGIHVVEPVLRLLGDQGGIAASTRLVEAGRRIVSIKWQRGTTATFTALGSTQSPIEIRLFGEAGTRTLTFGDTFYAFRQALLQFVRLVQTRNNPIEREFVRRVVQLIEAGNREN